MLNLQLFFNLVFIFLGICFGCVNVFITNKYYHNKNIKDEIQIFDYNSFLLNYIMNAKQVFLKYP